MAQLVAREKELQEQKIRKEKSDAERSKLLQRFLDSDAQTYLTALKKNEPHIGKRVEDIILYLIVYRNLREIPYADFHHLHYQQINY